MSENQIQTTPLKLFGAIIAVIGGWAALVAYAGPEFGYPMPPGSDQPAWEWSASHTWRHLLPGVVAITGGILLFLARSRRAAVIGGFTAFAAGAWMILSPFVVRAWLETGGGGGGDASTAMQILTPLGYHHVPGILTVGLAALALGGMLLPARRDLEPPREGHRPDSSERRAHGAGRFQREPAGAKR